MRERNLSIDMFRGITMLLMVFVNEFWKVRCSTSWAAPWLTGWVGVGKCALMATVYIACAWGLTKAGIQLKI